MPSPPFKLNQNQLSFTISVPLATGWIWIDNPTGSPILLAIGRTDVPTQDSADVFIPMLSSILVPTYGARDFGLGFQSPSALGAPIPQKTATVIVGQRGEVAPMMGSIQQNKQQYYDRPNFLPIVSLLGVNNICAGGSNVQVGTNYQVPPNRKAVVTVAGMTLIRSIVSSNPNNGAATSSLVLTITDPSNTSYNMIGTGAYMGPDKNYVGALSPVVIPIQFPLLAGWKVVGNMQNADPDGQIVGRMDVPIYEFDA